LRKPAGQEFQRDIAPEAGVARLIATPIHHAHARADTMGPTRSREGPAPSSSRTIAAASNNSAGRSRKAPASSSRSSRNRLAPQRRIPAQALEKRGAASSPFPRLVRRGPRFGGAGQPPSGPRTFSCRSNQSLASRQSR
jgi:hypothetical protein